MHSLISSFIIIICKLFWMGQKKNLYLMRMFRNSVIDFLRFHVSYSCLVFSQNASRSSNESLLFFFRWFHSFWSMYVFVHKSACTWMNYFVLPSFCPVNKSSYSIYIKIEYRSIAMQTFISAFESQNPNTTILVLGWFICGNTGVSFQGQCFCFGPTHKWEINSMKIIYTIFCE